MYKILVTGSEGQLGSHLKIISKEFNDYKYFFTDKNELDICNKELVFKFINDNKINIIINCAAYTAVDKAETDFKLANNINHNGVKNLGLAAKKYLCKLIHISTDYVFDGAKKLAYTEQDITNPLNIYGKTKLAGEEALKIINPKNCIIIRTSWIFSKIGNNFVNNMIKLGRVRNEINVVGDQIGSPTYALDLAKMILQIIPKVRNTTITTFHYTNDGFCSWADFATEIFKISTINCKVNSITSLDYPSVVKRPFFSVMDKTKIKKKFGLKIPKWEESLNKMLNN